MGILIYLGLGLILGLVIGKAMSNLGNHDEPITQEFTKNEVDLSFKTSEDITETL